MKTQENLTIEQILELFNHILQQFYRVIDYQTLYKIHINDKRILRRDDFWMRYREAMEYTSINELYKLIDEKSISIFYLLDVIHNNIRWFDKITVDELKVDINTIRNHVSFSKIRKYRNNKSSHMTDGYLSWKTNCLKNITFPFDEANELTRICIVILNKYGKSFLPCPTQYLNPKLANGKIVEDGYNKMINSLLQ